VTGVPNTAYPGGPLEILVNNTKWMGERITGVGADGVYTTEPVPGFTPSGNGDEYVSELPVEGTTEIWEIVNLTADAHPIHLHLAQFQVLNRQRFNASGYTKAYAAAFPGGGYDPTTGAPYPPGVYMPGWGPPLPYAKGPASGGKYGGNPDITPFLRGPRKPPLPYEAGWKDTVISYPAEVARFVVRWAPTDLPANIPAAQAGYPFDPDSDGHGYVWHCHIIDHEDNEMMRPSRVVPNPAAPRTYTKGNGDY
jgi:FtsP/CotA-like multicopper oxidase with cupredoxin domain